MKTFKEFIFKNAITKFRGNAIWLEWNCVLRDFLLSICEIRVFFAMKCLCALLTKDCLFAHWFFCYSSSYHFIFFFTNDAPYILTILLSKFDQHIHSKQIAIYNNQIQHRELSTKIPWIEVTHFLGSWLHFLCASSTSNALLIFSIIYIDYHN